MLRSAIGSNSWQQQLWTERPSRYTAIRSPTPHPSRPIRHFSTSQCLLKKGGKAAREEKQAAAKDPASEDPYDFSNLEADIATAIERLKSDLSKLRAGGRFNPEVVENLRVQAEKSSNQTVRLSDLAQVIPKGRTVQVLVGEKDVGQLVTTQLELVGD